MRVHCKEIYAAYNQKSAELRDFVRTASSVLVENPDFELSVFTIPYYAHKIYVRPKDDVGGFVTLYVLRHSSRHRDKMVHKLAIAAVDIKTKMLEDGDFYDKTDECVVCFEGFGERHLWKCKQCRNRLHKECAASWCAKCTTCPFCRTTF